MDFKNFKEVFGNRRIRELEDQLAKNNPILEEAADYIELLEAKVAELEAKLAKYENLEPVGYFGQEYVGGPVLFYQVNYKAEGSIPLYALEIK